MGLVLARAGYEVLTAFSAHEGWDLFQRQAPQVCAVVTELAMPATGTGWSRPVGSGEPPPTRRRSW
jgi:CheY-like chemotaxis protein